MDNVYLVLQKQNTRKLLQTLQADLPYSGQIHKMHLEHLMLLTYGTTTSSFGFTPTGINHANFKLGLDVKLRLGNISIFFTFRVDYIKVTVHYNMDALPVQLLDFSVHQKNNSQIISWISSEEKNNARYMIERSLDGSEWNTIKQLEILGNTNGLTEYSIIDSSTFYGPIAYYKLSQQDLDKKITALAIQKIYNVLSEIKLVNHEAENKKIELLVNSEEPSESDTFQYLLISSLGEIVQENSFQTSNGIGMIDIEYLPKGLYQLILSDQNSKKIFRIFR
jgi:hypothetical protein